MPSERFRSSAVLVASSLAAFALLAAHSRGEPTLPPPAPGSTIESGPLPPVPDEDGSDAPPADPGAEHDVLTRGPIHEAFAEQYNDEPTAGLVIPKAPPEPIDELPPETMPDGNNIQWVPGYWGWDDDRQDFIWISGLWRDVPPGQRWVPGYWNQTPTGWQWVSGFWTGAEHAELDYLPQPPPTLEQGPNIAAPSDDQFWVPGTWSYVNTDYRWRPGYWAPAYDDWVWVPDRYIWTPYGFVFAPGYYDYRLPVRAVAFAPVYFSNVGWWHTHRRPFCPSVVLDVGPLTMHWWVRPNYCHYYFGDYYATNYYTGWGLQPWYSCSYGFAGYGGAWVGRPCRYDPLFVFYNGYHRRHHDIDFSDRMHRWHDHYRDHVDDRPRHTVREQRAFLADLERHGRNREQINNVKLGRSLNDFAAHPTDHDQKFVKLDGQQRERQRKVANETTQLAALRHDVEGNEGRRHQENDGQGRQRGNKNAETIALPGANEGNISANGDHGSRHGRKLELPKNQGAGDQTVVNGGGGNGNGGDGDRRGRKVKTPDGPPGGGNAPAVADSNSGSSGRSSRRGRGDNQSGNNDSLNGNNNRQGDNQRNSRGRRGGQTDGVPGNSLPGLDGTNGQDAGGNSPKGENRGRNRGGNGSVNQNPDASSGGNGPPGLDQGSNKGRNSRGGNSGGGGGNGASEIQIKPQGQGNDQGKGNGNNDSGRNNSRRGGGSKTSFNFDANGGGGSSNAVAEQGGTGLSGGNGARSRHSQGRNGNSMNFQGNNGGLVGNGSAGQGSGGNGGGRSGRGNSGGNGQVGAGGGNPGGQGASNANGGGSRGRHSEGGNSGGGGNRGGGKHKNN